MHVSMRLLPKLGYLTTPGSGRAHFTAEPVTDNQVIERRGCGEHKFRWRRTNTEPSRNTVVTEPHFGERTDPMEQQHVPNP